MKFTSAVLFALASASAVVAQGCNNTDGAADAPVVPPVVPTPTPAGNGYEAAATTPASKAKTTKRKGATKTKTAAAPTGTGAAKPSSPSADPEQSVTPTVPGTPVSPGAGKMPPQGTVEKLSAPSVITGSFDGGNKEYDRGVPCGTGENGSDAAVFILEDGASISNVIIGTEQREGIHCKGACTITNVWIRQVCEDGITLLGTGDVRIAGGGAAGAKDKVIQHNGRGTVTITDYTVDGAGKVYRSCGNCTGNGGPRIAVIIGLRASGITAEVAGINSNYGDKLTIGSSCGAGAAICQEYTGVDKSTGKESSKLSDTSACLGEQGKMAELPAC
ncbi:Pectin lyase-like protein [Diplocarpon rosae]|nr:Pectin lyase-like protein [Diplocarpon rosae]